MSFLKKSRFIYWFVQELSQRYKKQIIFGLIIGSLSFIALQAFLIPYYTQKAKKTEFVGIIGDYTVSTLPSFILNQISFGLTTLDGSGNTVAGLATDWEATDSGKKYVFHISTDMIWHDGTNVDINDINYNIKDVTATRNPPNTIIYDIPMQFSPFLTVVSKPIFKKGLIGYGPMYVSGLMFKGGTFLSLTLSSRDQNIPNRLYKFYKTEPQAVLAYKQGEVDTVLGLALPDPIMKSWKNTNVEKEVHHDRMVSLFFNIKDPLLQEKSLRQALAYAVPTIEEERAFSPIGKTSWAYTDEVKHYAYDEIQAKKLFDATKMSTSSASLTLNTFSQYVPLAQSIADSWTKLGIPTEVKVENTLPSSYQVLLSARDIPSDPDQYAFWHSTQISTNISNYSNAKIDKLLEDGRRETDQSKRKTIYTDFQKRLVDDAPAVFLYYPKTYTIRRK